MLLRIFRIKCDGCGVIGAASSVSEFDAYSLAQRGGIFKHNLDDGKISDLCQVCRDKARSGARPRARSDSQTDETT